jgi:hypothetical protein
LSRQLQFPRPLGWDTDYWLCRCEGFTVDAPGGRVGVVEEVRFASRLDRPDELLVRGGLFGGRSLLVRVTDVEEIAPQRERVVLRSEPRPRHTPRLARLRAYLAATLGTR